MRAMTALAIGMTLVLALSGCGDSGAPAPAMTSPPVATVLSGTSGPVYIATASDPANRPVTFALVGEDAADFTIDAASGAVAFAQTPDYDQPHDRDHDNEYVVTIKADNGAAIAAKTVSINVAPVTGNRPYSWTNASWGGGGYVSGLLYHPKVKDLLYARTDVGGVYRWDAAHLNWIALNDDLGRDDWQLTGILSMAVDPNNAGKLYLAAGQYLPSWGRLGAILRSSDQGATWKRTELPIHLGGNWDGRGEGERLQVDPNKGSILFLGTNQDGLYKSTDSGVTWAKVPGFAPTATTFVLFGKGGTTGQATQTLYVGTQSNSTTSLMRSTDGGATWSAVPGQPFAFMPQQAVLDDTGNLYVTFANGIGPNGITDGAVAKLDTATGTWSDITPVKSANGQTLGYSGVSVAVTKPGEVVVSTIDYWWPGDTVFLSMDGGAHWTSLKEISHLNDAGFTWLDGYYGGDLSNRMGHWMTDVEIDPFNSDNAIYNTGYGVWMTTYLTKAAPYWFFNNKGLEETVITDIDSPQSGAHLLITQGDVGGGRYSGFVPRSDNSYFVQPAQTDYAVQSATLAPNLAVRTTSAAGNGYWSGDNGRTWTKMKTSPVLSGHDVGRIAISASGTSVLWVPKGQAPAVSSDNGDTWTTTTGWPTVPSDQYFNPIPDAAADGYYYVYDYPNARLFESSDGGKTFAATITSGLPQWQGSDIVSIPGPKRRDLWIATEAGLYHIDGPTAQPVKMPGVDVAYRVTYGAPAPAKLYWSLFVWGKVGGVTGLYRSDDKGASWLRINDDLHQYGGFNDISGDPRIYGRIYLGTGGRGLIVGNP